MKERSKRFQFPAIIRTKRNFLVLCAAIGAILAPPLMWDFVPAGTSVVVWLLIAAAGAAGNMLTGLFIWAIIGPAVSTGTRFIFFTEPTPPQDEPDTRSRKE